jgi:HSP20 family protein
MSMNLIRRQDAWDPFRELVDLQQELSRIVHGRGLAPAQTQGAEGAEWHPGVDIREEKDRIVVRTDLPGMRQEDISVEVADGTLTIRGERKQEEDTAEGRYHRVERSYGLFVRSFALPEGIDPGAVSATYRNGVLDVTLPKREEVKPKHVKVEVK